MISTHTESTQPKEKSILEWISNGVMTFATYALKHPGQLAFAVLLLSAPALQTISRGKKVEFDEYKTSLDPSTHIPNYYSVIFPKMDISPLAQYMPSDALPQGVLLPHGQNITKHYMNYHHVILEEKGYFARGDDRSPISLLDNKISPKCGSGTPPHGDISTHRISSECSGFVSLTDDLLIAHHFGNTYADQHLLSNDYYIYIAKMEYGLAKDKQFDRYHESEHSTIGPAPIVSHRKCHGYSRTAKYDCGNVFVRKDLDPNLKKKILQAQLLPYEQVDQTPLVKKSSSSFFAKAATLPQVKEKEADQSPSYLPHVA